MTRIQINPRARRTRTRQVLAGLAAAALVVAVAPVASAASLNVASPCPAVGPASAASFYRAAPSEFVAISFTLPAATQTLLSVSTAYHGSPGGLAAERVVVTGALEASGAHVGTVGLVQFGSDVHAVAGDLDAHAVPLDAAPDGAGCVTVTVSKAFDLGAGGHRFVVYGATDIGKSGIGAYLPETAIVTNVERGASSRISEAEMACAERLSVSAGPVASHSLTDCILPLASAGSSYATVFTGRCGDADHQVRWVSESGASDVPCNAGGGLRYSYKTTRQGAGVSLAVPRYVTRVASGLEGTGLPQDQRSDPGIFGAFVPAGS